MHGIRRVLIFCTLTTILPTMLLVIPLYLRHSFYANVAYAVTESDILEITDGISTIFCSEHTLQMNGTFNAFQMAQKPEVTSYRKHIRLKKSMNLPDDTLEYWGFYLLKGATVALSVCSRFQGASILVVKGERNLRTCGMLEHNDNKQMAEGIYLPEANRQVKITFESNAQEINSKESTTHFDEDVLNHVTTEDINKNNRITLDELSKNIRPENLVKMVTDFGTNKNNNTEKVHEQELQELFQSAKTYLQKHIESQDTINVDNTRKLRHIKLRHHKHRTEQKNKNTKLHKRRKKRKDTENRTNTMEYSKVEHDRLVQLLKTELNRKEINEENIQREEEEGRDDKMIIKRLKRSQELVKPQSLLDHGIQHGGNAGRNATDIKDESSVSSFENGLFNCYGGSILLAQEFAPSDQCINVSYLLNGKHMQTRHNVTMDGYYYYIFYSDNDIVSNDIHALFDIYKPTFQYENVTKSCLNQTKCSFSLNMLSPDRVIVEIPTKDGIEHEIDDISLLISICHPRMGVYIIFPIAVLLFILTCAFM